MKEKTMELAISPKARKLWDELQDAVAEEGQVPCQSNPDLFFANYGQDPQAEWQRAQAVRMCMACPVAKLCLDYALEADEREGIWGGHRTSERRAMLRALRRTRAHVARLGLDVA